VTDDRTFGLLGGRVRLYEQPGLYHPSEDAVWLASAIQAAPGESVFELGLGTAAAALCVLARCPGTTLTGAEPEPALRAAALRNRALNHLTDRLTVLDASATTLPPLAADHAFANPPFYDPATHATPASALRAKAHAMPLAEAGIWANALGRVSKSVTLIVHRDQVPVVQKALPGAVVVWLHTSPRKEPKRAVVHAGLRTRGGRVDAWDEAVRTAVLKEGRSVWEFVIS
jgi:methylase of polypeptide subunit release factors